MRLGICDGEDLNLKDANVVCSIYYVKVFKNFFLT